MQPLIFRFGPDDSKHSPEDCETCEAREICPFLNMQRWLAEATPEERKEHMLQEFVAHPPRGKPWLN